jgi:hypothetical protein
MRHRYRAEDRKTPDGSTAGQSKAELASSTSGAQGRSIVALALLTRVLVLRPIFRLVRRRDTRHPRARGPLRGPVRNRGERGGEELDSVQLFVLQVSDGPIVDVRIHVDGDAAVAEFWAD